MYIVWNFDYPFDACFGTPLRGGGGDISAVIVYNEGVVLSDNFPLHNQPPADTLDGVIVKWSMFI